MSDYALFIYDQTEALSTEERLKKALRLYLQTKDAEDTIARTPQGKPYFVHQPQVQFSVSHSGAYWACAMGSAPVGLDLQEHKDCKTKDLSRRFFHPEEHAALRKDGFALIPFFRIWSGKESYVKFKGTGLLAETRDFSVLSLEGAVLRRIPFLPNYSLCLCAQSIGEVVIHPFF